MGARVQASLGSGEEKWLKIRGRGHYGFVVLDGATALPVLAVRLPSRGQWAWRWVGRQWRPRKKGPQGLIPAG
jgi:hypothetical protein